MTKLTRKKRLIFFVVIVFLFSATLQTNASILGGNPITFLQKTTRVIISRVSDLIYYLVMQKRYIFDDFVDPNTYVSLDIPANFEEILDAVSPVDNVVSTSTPEPISKKLIEVTTTTVPEVKKATSTPEPVQGQIIPTAPILIVKPPPVSVPIPEIIEEPIVNNNYNSDDEILIFTNKERLSESLKPLSANHILDKIAGLRADDLFANQYFEHVSPDGQSASGLAQDIGYDYLLIGENLALGNFDGEKGIVSAWMESPGHRANILNGKYTELGISLKEGLFNDSEVTIAVQIFGLPMANCSKPNSGTKTLIESSVASIKQMQEQAKIMYNNLEVMKNSPELDRAYYNQKIQEYNYFAKKVNDAINGLKEMTDSYNGGVVQYNLCISSSLL
jgi:uncharacterized protein YkwD